MNRKRVFRRTGTGRRILSCLFAFVWLFSASGLSAFAENDIIYSEPVTVPIRMPETPQPEAIAEEVPDEPVTEENPDEAGALPAGETEEAEPEPADEEARPDAAEELPENSTGDEETVNPDETAAAAEPA